MSDARPAADGPRPALQRLLAVLRPLWFVVAVGIVVAMAVLAARDVDLGELRWWLLAPAVVAAIGWWVALARIWALVVAGEVRREDVVTWCRTQTLRFLPGGIWAPASRIAVTRGAATDRVATVAAENVIALCAAAAIGGTCLALAGRPAWAPLALAVAVPAIAARAVRARSRLDAARTTAATLTALGAFAAYVAAAVLTQASVSGWDDPLIVAGGAAIAWSVGLVAVFAPGGVGVRELVYVGLLTGTVSRPSAAAAAVTLRLVTIVAELLVLVAVGRAPKRR